ncbi:hypothetical protein [Teichococcus aestuarii]|uniref:hypothetical protein n=1 Tax=Teichococcus aestuarii TaxID=568898 RepID=UPI003610ED76
MSGWLIGWLAARRAELGAALGLMTRLPLGRWPMPEAPEGFARAAWAYPLAGALAGGLAGELRRCCSGPGCRLPWPRPGRWPPCCC